MSQITVNIGPRIVICGGGGRVGGDGVGVVGWVVMVWGGWWWAGWPRHRENGIWMLTFPDRGNTGNLVNLNFHTGKIVATQGKF